MPSRWTQVVPWDRQGHLNLTNTAYVVAFCRRYRLERPMRYRGPDKCKCGWSRVGLGRCEFDGDHDECVCEKRQWARTLVHHTIVDALVRFLKDVGMVKCCGPGVLQVAVAAAVAAIVAVIRKCRSSS